MTIYLTPFDPDTKECLAHSADSGFSTLQEVRAAMGESIRETPSYAVYPGGLLFSYLAWYLG